MPYRVLWCHSCQLLTRLPLARVGLGLGAERERSNGVFLRPCASLGDRNPNGDDLIQNVTMLTSRALRTGCCCRPFMHIHSSVLSLLASMCA